MTEATIVPGYEQVKSFVQTHIRNGQWRPGHRVPSEAELVKQFALSRMTVNRALRELANQGLIIRVRGSGTVVANLNRVSARLEIRDIHEQIRERGHLYASILLHKGRERAPRGLAKVLGVRTNSFVFHTLMVHSENGVPLQCEDRYVNPLAAPGYLDNDFANITPTHYLLQHAPLTEAHYSIEAVLPSIQEAQALNISGQEPCLVMTRHTLSGENVASIARLVYPGSRYCFDGAIQP
jgi:GntR family transcriptional regulator, histidine utilization repressor